ncbi:MAG: hypothetical protein KDB93_08490 [Flavobacteriales bacterium]|nr:hypothetical protein [Flavobacteriales bacterium]
MVYLASGLPKDEVELLDGCDFQETLLSDSVIKSMQEVFASGCGQEVIELPLYILMNNNAMVYPVLNILMLGPMYFRMAHNDGIQHGQMGVHGCDDF